jgi:hypothetical protein
VSQGPEELQDLQESFMVKQGLLDLPGSRGLPESFRVFSVSSRVFLIYQDPTGYIEFS